MPVAVQMTLVAMGGAAGALARFGLTTLAGKQLGQSFPWGTLVVNVLGCWLIGRLMSSPALASEGWRLILAVGFLGSFTTFSALGAETFALLRAGKTGLAVTYALSSLLIGLLAVTLGWRMGTPK